MQPPEDREQIAGHAHSDPAETFLHCRSPYRKAAASPHTPACPMASTIHRSSNTFANDNVGGQQLEDSQWPSIRHACPDVCGRHSICRACNVAKDIVVQHALHHRKRPASMQPEYREVTAPSRSIHIIEQRTPHNEEVANSHRVRTTNPQPTSPSVDAQPRLIAACDTEAVVPRTAHSGTSLASPEPNVTR
jgi:hypothetical protein